MPRLAHRAAPAPRPRPCHRTKSTAGPGVRQSGVSVTANRLHVSKLTRPSYGRAKCQVKRGRVPSPPARAIRRRVRGVRVACVLAFACLAIAVVAGRGAEPETVGKVLTLAEQPGPHW